MPPAIVEGGGEEWRRRPLRLPRPPQGPSPAALQLRVHTPSPFFSHPRNQAAVGQEEVESELFRWASVHLTLPPLIGDGEAVEAEAALFAVPDVDELRELAEDAGGAAVRLTPAQLSQIAEGGEFAVPSRAFPGPNLTGPGCLAVS